MIPKQEEIQLIKYFLQTEYARIVKDTEWNKEEKREPMELVEFLWECIRREKEIRGYMNKKKEEIER